MGHGDMMFCRGYKATFCRHVAVGAMQSGVLAVFLVVLGVAGHPARAESAVHPWRILIGQAEALGLPTKFLRGLPETFITIEFDDLHEYAAEYHPEEHRMVLDRTLSFNAASGALRPLASLTPREVGTLYHELFHAYMDYVQVVASNGHLKPEEMRLLTFARRQQVCRYQIVSITPVIQRKTDTEARYLTPRESWEALNETWGVFVGWATWTRLELRAKRSGRESRDWGRSKAWLARLSGADQAGELVGYYEPEDPDEKKIARKRYLGPTHRITPFEIAVILEILFEESPRSAARSAAVMEQDRLPTGELEVCDG
jgi:hypothetical protein